MPTHKAALRITMKPKAACAPDYASNWLVLHLRTLLHLLCW